MNRWVGAILPPPRASAARCAISMRPGGEQFTFVTQAAARPAAARSRVRAGSRQPAVRAPARRAARQRCRPELALRARRPHPRFRAAPAGARGAARPAARDLVLRRQRRRLLVRRRRVRWSAACARCCCIRVRCAPRTSRCRRRRRPMPKPPPRSIARASTSCPARSRTNATRCLAPLQAELDAALPEAGPVVATVIAEHRRLARRASSRPAAFSPDTACRRPASARCSKRAPVSSAGFSTRRTIVVQRWQRLRDQFDRADAHGADARR